MKLEVQEAGEAPRRSLSLIMNPAAAEDEALQDALVRLRKLGHRVRTAIPQAPGEATQLTAAALEEGADTVVACGGDGTINEVLNGMRLDDHSLRPDCALGVIPFGTANDFCSGAGFDGMDARQILTQILDAKPRMVDVGRVNGERLFLNVASGGVPAELTAETSRPIKRALGSLAYLVKGLINIADLSAVPLKLRGEGFGWQGECYLLAVGNGRLAGGGFHISPEARIDDGLLDVVVITAELREVLKTLLEDLLEPGLHLEHEHVVYHRTPWLEIESDHDLQVNLDGEPIHGRSLRFDLLPRALPLYLPSLSPMLTAEEPPAQLEEGQEEEDR